MQGSIEGEYNIFYFNFNSDIRGFEYIIGYFFESLDIDISKVIIEEVNSDGNNYRLTILDPKILDKILEIKNRQ